MTEDLTPEADPSCPGAEEDVLWMERVKKGDEEAFRLLIEKHQSRIIGTVAKMLGDDTDSEDIAQQVFIRVWNSAARYQPTAKFTTWLFKITRNLVFNELRRRKRHPAAHLEQTEGRPPLSNARSEFPLARNRDGGRRITGRHPARHRFAAGSAADGNHPAAVRGVCPYEEIAEVLKLSVPAVKSILFRARTDLRAQLQKYLDE